MILFQYDIVGCDLVSVICLRWNKWISYLQCTNDDTFNNVTADYYSIICYKLTITGSSKIVYFLSWLHFQLEQVHKLMTWWIVCEIPWFINYPRLCHTCDIYSMSNRRYNILCHFMQQNRTFQNNASGLQKEFVSCNPTKRRLHKLHILMESICRKISQICV